MAAYDAQDLETIADAVAFAPRYEASSLGVQTVTVTVTVTNTVFVNTEKRFANVHPQKGRQYDVPLGYRGRFGLNGRGR